MQIPHGNMLSAQLYNYILYTPHLSGILIFWSGKLDKKKWKD